MADMLVLKLSDTVMVQDFRVTQVLDNDYLVVLKLSNMSETHIWTYDYEYEQETNHEWFKRMVDLSERNLYVGCALS
jgi:hypothetical protein